jgi:hypothetical protein
VDETESTEGESRPDVSDGGRLDRRFELLEAIVLAIAAVLTAWAAFQATLGAASRPTTAAAPERHAPSRPAPPPAPAN